MFQELPYEDFSLKIYTDNTDSFYTKTLWFSLNMYEKEMRKVCIITPIETIEDLQKQFDFVIVALGIEFCRIDQLNKYYDYYAPHVKEILSNYCIRENNDEEIKDVNLLYIRSKFLEESM